MYAYYLREKAKILEATVFLRELYFFYVNFYIFIYF